VLVALALVALGACLYVPAIAAIFRFAPLGPAAVAASVTAGFAYVLWYDAVKIAGR
jgi:hypothetical protein